MGIHVTPRGLLEGEAARAAIAPGNAWPLLGQERAFAVAEVRTGRGPRFVARADAGRVEEIVGQIAALARPRAPFCGLALDAPRIMGVVNVTPDSFSDGGRFLEADRAVAHGVALAEAGAAIIDVGGESTRPGSDPIGDDAEIARAVPVVAALADRGLLVSIDSRKPRVIAAALGAGARIVNDITGLSAAESIAAVATAKAGVVLMHMQGEPHTMQDNPSYAWAPGDIYDWLAGRVAACIHGGIPIDRIALDPGLGFGKTDAHNAEILNHLALFHGLGCALVLGASRKGFIGRAGGGVPAAARLPGSLAASLHAAGQGVQMLRVHDVAETRQALLVAARIQAAR